MLMDKIRDSNMVWTGERMDGSQEVKDNWFEIGAKASAIRSIIPLISLCVGSLLNKTVSRPDFHGIYTSHSLFNIS